MLSDIRKLMRLKIVWEEARMERGGQMFKDKSLLYLNVNMYWTFAPAVHIETIYSECFSSLAEYQSTFDFLSSYV